MLLLRSVSAELSVIKVFENYRYVGMLSGILDRGDRWNVVAESTLRNHGHDVKKQLKDIAQQVERGLKFLKILETTELYNITWRQFKEDAIKEGIHDIRKITSITPETKIEEWGIQEMKDIARVISIDERWKKLATNSYRGKFIKEQITSIETYKTLENPKTAEMLRLMEQLQLPMTMKELAQICHQNTYDDAVEILKEICVEESSRSS